MLAERRATGARHRARPRRRLAPPRAKEHWGWNWSETRKVLDYLFFVGRRRHRRAQQPVRGASTTCPSGCCPPSVLAAPTPDAAGGRHASWSAVPRARTASRPRQCLRRLLPAAAPAEPGKPARWRSTSWSRRASCSRCAVEGWKRPAYLHRDARLPRRVDARALLSPFDPVVWERARTEALFDFHYRIEIYVPAEKRVHGYYVLPFLLGDRIVARVDLKADRATRACCSVQGGVRRAAAPRRRPPSELAAELRRLAGWLGLDDVVVEPRGDLAPRCALTATAGWRRRRLGRRHPLGRVAPHRRHCTRSCTHVPAILDKILRIGEGKILRQLEAIAKAVNAIEDDFVAMSDDELRGRPPSSRSGSPTASPSTT